MLGHAASALPSRWMQRSLRRHRDHRSIVGSVSTTWGEWEHGRDGELATLAFGHAGGRHRHRADAAVSGLDTPPEECEQDPLLDLSVLAAVEGSDGFYPSTAMALPELLRSNASCEQYRQLPAPHPQIIRRGTRTNFMPALRPSPVRSSRQRPRSHGPELGRNC
jgi:hypothetical protein